MNILAIETSTSSIKAMIYSTKDGVIDVKLEAYPENVCNVSTIDADGMINTLVKCVSAIIEANDCSIDMIGLCSAWHSLLALDKNREPVSKIMTWAYTESSETVYEYKHEKGIQEKFYSLTGCPIHSIYPLWKYIDYVKKNGAENISYISSQLEYVFEKLTSDVAASTCLGSGTGLMNIHNLQWDEEILDFAGININQLSPLYELDYNKKLSKEGADLLGLKEGIPVVLGGSDGALNQIGAGAIKKGIMTLSVGTSGALRMISPTPVIPDKPSTWCYYVGEGNRMAGAATNGAGNCVQWFAKKINRGLMSYKDLDNEILNINTAKAPVYLPFNYGERSPGWDDARLGSFSQLTGENSIFDMYYSVLEGIIFNLYQSYKVLTDIAGSPYEIRISGGIINSPIWLQMAADIFQCKLTVSNIEHASTIGAIGLVLKAAGEIKSLDEFDMGKGKVINPQEDKKEFYTERFEKYMGFYNSFK